MAPGAGSQQKAVTSGQRKPLYQKLGTEIVNIVVGEEKKKFVLHKNLICTSSPVFERMFNGSFKEGKTQTAKLPDDDVESFALFQGWLYNETIEHSNITEGDGNFTGQLVKLFLFAEKYDIVRLEDKTMDTLLAGKSNNIIPSLTWITKGYKNTRKGSVLRLYLSRAWVWVTMTSEEAPAWKNEGLAKALGGDEDLLLDVVTLLRGKWATKPLDPRNAPRCDYYQHGKDKKCSYPAL